MTHALRPVEPAALRIGLGDLDRTDLRSLFRGLEKAIRTGLDRQGASTTTDGGLLAIRTGIPLVTREAWDQVPANATAFVAAVAGTNWDFQLAKKEQGGGVSLRRLRVDSYPDDQRKVPFVTFLQRMAEPIAEACRLQPSATVRVGLSLGFPHANSPSTLGVDAQLLTESGRLPKGWEIVDWEGLPQEQRQVGEALPGETARAWRPCRAHGGR